MLNLDSEQQCDNQPAWIYIMIWIYVVWIQHAFNTVSFDQHKKVDSTNYISCDGCMALPRGAMGLSAVCDCGIS